MMGPHAVAERQAAQVKQRQMRGSGKEHMCKPVC